MGGSLSILWVTSLLGSGVREWLDGKCTGNGTTTFKSGSRYVGVYHEDKMNGHGARPRSFPLDLPASKQP